ncbi:unnamed protein product [Closterium sp. Yama58-4]|nr:unnamed protein product [Closterium sp. Yama58-4]
MGLEEDLAISPVTSTAIGGLAGVIEVLLQQPLVTWKNAVQDMRPVPLHPRLLYRGVAVNAASIAPINGFQFGANTFLEEWLAARGQLNDTTRTGAATAAGAMSGIITGPAELLMIQQQKWGGSLGSRLRDVVGEHGVFALSRGTNPAVVREAIFTGAYLGVIPVMTEHMEKAWPVFAERPVAAMATASVLAGVGAAVLTQPFDTVKTRMQANLADPNFRSMSGTFARMWREGGSKTLFRGLIPRAQRVTFAVFILSEAKERLTDLYLKLHPHPAAQSHASDASSSMSLSHVDARRGAGHLDAAAVAYRAAACESATEEV